MALQTPEKPVNRPKKPRTHDVSYRKEHLDPHLHLMRKLQTPSFLPIVARVFSEIPRNGVVMGGYLAKHCRGYYSDASVWNHLHWMVEREILTQRYDGKCMFFGWNPDMPKEAYRICRIIDAECQRYWHRWQEIRERKNSAHLP